MRELAQKQGIAFGWYSDLRLPDPICQGPGRKGANNEWLN